MPAISPALRMLVVDDNRDVADVMADVLRLEGHDVRVSYGGSHALHVANEFVPQIVIVDITMPELDGFEIATLIRAQSAAKKAVLVAHTASDRAALAMRTDVVFHFHVLKPATPAEFAPAIELARKLEPARRERSPGTLGDVLYSKSKTLVLEAEWVALVRSVAAGNHAALHALFERAFGPVFTLVARILASRKYADELTLNVFDGIWRRAGCYDASKATVLGWIMNQARSRAVDRRAFDRRRKRVNVKDPMIAANAPDSPGVTAAKASLHRRLAQRIARETGGDAVIPPTRHWSGPEWQEVSPGIHCKLLATDVERHRISMLVQLMPGVEYPPHSHAEFEELHLLEGELWIDERKLHPGDYNRAEAPSADKRVWSETGCTCVLITSTLDTLT